MEGFDGAELRKRRLEAGLTQAELGHRAGGISGSDISAYELGRKPPRWDRWHRIETVIEDALDA